MVQEDIWLCWAAKIISRALFQEGGLTNLEVTLKPELPVSQWQWQWQSKTINSELVEADWGVFTVNLKRQWQWSADKTIHYGSWKQGNQSVLSHASWSRSFNAILYSIRAYPKKKSNSSSCKTAELYGRKLLTKSIQKFQQLNICFNHWYITHAFQLN